MGRTREIQCIHYINHGNCDLGKNADFYGLCQTCPSYSPLRHGRPARTDNRKQKRERELRRDFIKEEW